MNLAESKKQKVHINPVISPNPVVRLIILLIFVLSFLACASEIAGRSITQTELKRTPGKRMTGAAIPLRTP